MYQWTRKDVANVRLGLLIGLPLLAFLAPQAFDGGAMLLRILVVGAILAELALAVRLVLVQRAFARVDREAGEVDR